MAIKRKLKKVKKSFLISYIILCLSFLISIIFLTISLSYLANIETVLRIIFLAVTYIFWFTYLLYALIWIFKKKRIRYILLSLVVAIFIPINFIVSSYINKTYNVIDNINKDEEIYTTNLVMLRDTKFNNSPEFTVGLLSNEDDYNGYLLPHELIDKEKLDKVTIKEFSDYPELLKVLYNNEVNAIFLPNGYATLFSEEYPTIAKDTKGIYKLSKTNKRKKNDTTKVKKLTEPFTILLLGVDSTIDGLKANQVFNGDAIMLITFNPKTLTGTFLSIPRDTYVPITCNKNLEAKINHAAYGGATCMMNTITKLTDIDIDYYFKMNFTGIVDLVDTLNGIDVNVPYKFCEQNSKREWGNKIVYVNAGMQHLNGEQALALSRNRKPHPEYCSSEWNSGTRNDFVRGQNQQLVVQGILDKLKNLRNLDDFYKVLGVISNNMDTNMNTETMLSFYNVLKDILRTYLENTDEQLKIQKLYLQTTNLMIAGAGSTEQYQKKSLEVIKNAMKYNLGLAEAKLNKTFTFDINKPYEEVLLGKGLYDGTTRKVLPNFIGKTKNDVYTWALANSNINVIYTDVISDDVNYKEEYENGTVVTQSVRGNTLLENVTSVTFGIIKK